MGAKQQVLRSLGQVKRAMTLSVVQGKVGLIRFTPTCPYHSLENWVAGSLQPNKGPQNNRKALVRNTLYLTPEARQHSPSETKVHERHSK